MKRTIKNVAVLGSGIMGSRIAAVFAGIGVPVLLLDRLPDNLLPGAGKKERNSLTDAALAAAAKSKPSPLYTKQVLKLIRTGNFADDMPAIAKADWIIEVIIEQADAKKALFAEVEKYRRPGTIVSSNTSGIPIGIMTEGRSEDFIKHFCGTHFFNPPRYLRLLEIIPTRHTSPEVVDFLLTYGDLFLGKTTVLAKDSPAFIANRIGVFAMMTVIHEMEKLQLSIDETELLTGPIIGRPKSATFRTADVVGLDTLVRVADGVSANCPSDEARETFAVPDWMKSMLSSNLLGDKTGKGFFQKIKSAEGKAEIQVLNLSTLAYEARTKPKFASIDSARSIEDLAERLKFLMSATDKAGEFFRAFHYALFAYVSHRVPEICDNLYSVDDAMKAGFNWEVGPFETWDILGVQKTLEAMRTAGYKVADWVEKMVAAGNSKFFRNENGRSFSYDPVTENYVEIPGSGEIIIMKNSGRTVVWKNSACSAYDLGDDVLGLQWNTKMNSIGGEVLEGIQRSIALAEEKFKGLVIANDGPNFSAGANIAMIFMLAAEQDYDEIDMAIRVFQETMMRVRYSSIPVIIAPHGLALGGGCEICLHADKVVAAAETYTGLVEMGIGVIPGGGGTKEFVLRAADEMHPGEPETITLQNRFLSIATTKVSTSGFEGFENGIYRFGTDEVCMNPLRRVAVAKRAVMDMSDSGYNMPVHRTDIKVLGRSALGMLYAGINGMRRGNYATDHDVVVAKKLAYVMCGGDLSEQTLVTEQYLLDLEREAFLSLTGERKTLERLEAMLKTGKVLRN